MTNLLKEIVGTQLYNQAKTNLEKKYEQRLENPKQEFEESKGLLGNFADETSETGVDEFGF